MNEYEFAAWEVHKLFSQLQVPYAISETLDVYLRLDGPEIQLWDGKTGERLLTPQEAMEALRVAEAWAKKAKAELELLRAELELLRGK